MAIDHDKIQQHIRRISQVSIGIALFALVLVGVLYITLYTQKKNMQQTTTNTNVAEKYTLSPEQIAAEKSSYEEKVSTLFSSYVAGVTTSASVAEQMQKISVPQSYRSLHVQLLTEMQGSDLEADKLTKIQAFDTQYTWILP